MLEIKFYRSIFHLFVTSVTNKQTEEEKTPEAPLLDWPSLQPGVKVLLPLPHDSKHGSNPHEVLMRTFTTAFILLSDYKT